MCDQIKINLLLKLNRIIILICYLLLFINCSSQKTYKLATSGYITQKEFTKEIPFKYVKKHIFIDVEINNKSYTFLFDTGFDFSAIDINRITSEKYKKAFTKKISGSSIKTRKFQFIKNLNISIGDIDFMNIGASLFDLEYINKQYGCSNLKIAGVIGANLLRKAYWEIDYEKQMIKFSDKLENLTPTQNHIELNLISKGWGLVKLNVIINNKREELIFDTGSSGSITLPDSSFKNFNLMEYDTYVCRDFKNKKIYNNYTALLDNVKFGSYNFRNKFISFERGVSKLLGNQFLEKYNVIIDWNKNKLFLKEINNQILELHKPAISLNLVNDKIVITSVKKNTIYNSNLLDKEVVRINKIKLSNLKKNELCQFWKIEYPLIKGSKNIEIETTEGRVYNFNKSI